MKNIHLIFGLLFIIIMAMACYVFFGQMNLSEGFDTEGFGGKYTAIIVETRKNPALAFVLQDYLENLSSDWNIIIFHGKDNLDYIKNIHSTNLANNPRLTMINLGVSKPTTFEEFNKYYNELFYNKDFYKYIPTETFLVFKINTKILDKNRDKINNYLIYDYVGAPFAEAAWNKDTDKIGSGGFSIRKKSKMLQLLNMFPVDPSRPEDLFFSGLFDNKIKMSKPTYEQSKEFCVEQVFFSNPLAVSKPWKFMGNKPEYATMLKNYTGISKLKAANDKPLLP